ncbi:MAG: cysteine sulfinate desulfinase [Gemmatimonadetes bacterium RBG_16_66_8]|nr:MAG: cysteine sulfinate desulfinase [Gemmatimonadetes bacterium RBG_16_66_8]
MTRPAAPEARATRPAQRPAGLDLARIRADFPILGQRINGRPLVYLDNAATSQKPRHVIDAVRRYYEETNANVHRAVHTLSERATAAYEGARTKVQRFLNAAEPREIIFVRGTTEAINLVARSLGQARLRPGDEVLISAMEHHSNIVPWQLACEERGARLRVIPMNQDGELVLEDLDSLLNERTRILAVAHVSNSLGTVNPVAELIRAARSRGVPVLIDGAQAAPHLRVDVQALGCDFYAISGHKMFGPTGIGALYGRAELLEAMPPFQGGGDMIRTVTFERTTYAPVPHKFEAGTPNIAGAVGLGAAVDYLSGLDWDRIEEHERDVLAYAVERVGAAPGVRLIGRPAHRAGVVAFVMDAAHAHDVGTIVDRAGVAIRTGHHCTQPVMDFFGVPATARASFALYNRREDVDALVEALDEVLKVFT